MSLQISYSDNLVCRGRGLKRGSDESICQRARRWVRTQSRRRLWPFSRRNPKSSTYVKKEQQLLEEDPMSHTTKRQGRREVRVATWGCGEPRPVDGQPGTLPPNMPRFFGPVTPKQPRFPRPPSPKQPWFNRQLTIFTRDLDYSAHVNQTGPEHLEAKEAEPKGEKLGKVRVGLGWSCMGAYGEGLLPDTQGAPQSLEKNKEHPSVGLRVGRRPVVGPGL
ncbi:uncharacterized protein LOC129151740 [Eptesicus fuscus]|uniref:uncharacterized protein LOC129151740 n=1 Tax=Eptesicus fuscus TaxID=29078 RepID=UPI0024041CC2|nr:uncharacterized protein LOC129151740 [Eptesicus fuscus]